jgi:tetratricopeptide (TPR) repeat protein
MLTEDAELVQDPEEKAGLLLRAGELFLGVEDSEAASNALRQALALRPGDAHISSMLANACIAAGELGDADALLDEAIGACKGRRSPELALLQHGKSRVAYARGDEATRLEWLQQAFACDNKNGYIAMELADLAESLQEWDLAVRALRSLALMQDESPMPKAQAYLRQGRISHVRGDRQRAVLWARKARQEDPSEPAVTEFLAELGEA